MTPLKTRNQFLESPKVNPWSDLAKRPRQTVTITHACPEISRHDEIAVAELLAVCHYDPHTRNEWRRQRLALLPEADQPRIRDYFNRVVKARNDRRNAA
jgi:hypothetical protein